MKENVHSVCVFLCQWGIMSQGFVPLKLMSSGLILYLFKIVKNCQTQELKSTLQTKIIGCMSPEQQPAQSDLWSNSASWIITGLFLLLLRKHTTEISCSPGLSRHVILTRRPKAVKPSTSCYNTHSLRVRHCRDRWCLSVHICTRMWVCECLQHIRWEGRLSK